MTDAKPSAREDGLSLMQHMLMVRFAMSFNEEHALETYKSLITVSMEGLKTLLLINGGAVVAMLAFLGQ